MKQMTLFALPKKVVEPVVQHKPALPPPSGKVTLNGFYYETETDLFVSFVLGLRYYQVTGDSREGDAKWRADIKKTRSITLGPSEWHPTVKPFTHRRREADAP